MPITQTLVCYGDVISLRCIQTESLLTLDAEEVDGGAIDVKAGQPTSKACMAHRWRITRVGDSGSRDPVLNGEVVYLYSVDSLMYVRYLWVVEENDPTLSKVVTGVNIPEGELNARWVIEGFRNFEKTPGGPVGTGGSMSNLVYNTSYITLRNVQFDDLVLCVKGDKVEVVPVSGLDGGALFNVVTPESYTC